MEIERKYLIHTLPEHLERYPYREIEQGYLNTDPVVRIRRTDDEYTLTYKGKGLMIREEYNLPLNEASFVHLKEKIDGRLIRKRRYLIPLDDGLTVELDVFSGDLAPLCLAEVEFETEEAARAFAPPQWFAEEVTFSPAYHNSSLSRR
ncbi:MAG: CYTH domain-containing protein [Clostridiales bacterium]|nr:CYTH domain-containing protein [Clostridiales bacterium]